MTHVRIVPCPRNTKMIDVELYFPPVADHPEGLWWPYATLRAGDDPEPVLRVLCPAGYTVDPAQAAA